MKSKLWQKLFTQAIPFFSMLYMAFAVLWISADYALAYIDKTPVGQLTVTLATGIPVTLLAMVVSSAFDHWLQDHYKVDDEGKPREVQDGN